MHGRAARDGARRGQWCTSCSNHSVSISNRWLTATGKGKQVRGGHDAGGGGVCEAGTKGI